MKWMSLPATGLVVLITLSGCSSTPLVSRDAWGIETRAELQEWTVSELDASIAASGLPEGWVEIESSSDASPLRYWGTGRDEIISNIDTDNCYSGGHSYPKQLNIELVYYDPPLPFAAIDGVRTRWQSEGWTVTDIYPLDGEQSKTMQYVSARRDDGAVLAVQGTAKAISLSVSSVCSVHGSV